MRLLKFVGALVSCLASAEAQSSFILNFADGSQVSKLHSLITAAFPGAGFTSYQNMSAAIVELPSGLSVAGLAPLTSLVNSVPGVTLTPDRAIPAKSGKSYKSGKKFVQSADAEPARRPRRLAGEDDPFLEDQEGIKAGAYSLNFRDAWAANTGTNAVIAIFGTGVDATHEDLIDNLYSNPVDCNYDGVDDDANGYVDDCHGWNFVSDSNDLTDNVGTGTMEFGLVAASGNNGIGIAGGAYGAKVLMLKVCEDIDTDTEGLICRESHIIRALNYAIGLNVKVSLHGYGALVSTGVSKAMQAAMTYAETAGHVIVTNAGDDAVNTDTHNLKQFPAMYTGSNIISVASVSSAGDLSSFSNFGFLGINTAAPGEDQLTTTVDNNYDYVTGSRFAAAYVAASIGLILSAQPLSSVSEIVKLLQYTGKVIRTYTAKLSWKKMVAVNSLVNKLYPSYVPSTFLLSTAAGACPTTACSDASTTCKDATDGINMFYSTCMCDDGYQWNSVSSACEAIDECATRVGYFCMASPVAAVCTDLAPAAGSFSCACPAGYAGDGVSSCTDVNECVDGPGCALAGTKGSAALCTNTPGSFTCACAAGWKTSDDSSAVVGNACEADINECTTTVAAWKNKCLAITASCSNTDGAYTCGCKTGYTGDGMKTCADINECTLTAFSPLWNTQVSSNYVYRGASICAANTPGLGRKVCTNTVGSFSCTCPVGTYDNSNGGVVGKCLTAYTTLSQCKGCGVNSSCGAVTAIGGAARFACKCTATGAINSSGVCLGTRRLRSEGVIDAASDCEGGSCKI